MEGVNSVAVFSMQASSCATTSSICCRRIRIFSRSLARLLLRSYAIQRCICWLLIQSLCRQHIQHQDLWILWGKDEDYLGEYSVYLILDTVTETVYSPVIRFFIPGKPYEMNVTQQGLFYFTAGIDIVHIGIQNSFEHHSRVIGRTPGLLIQFMNELRSKLSTIAFRIRTGSSDGIFSSILCGKRTIWLGL